MHNRTSIAAGLRDTILSVVSRTPDRARVNSLVEVCRALASSYLRGKASSGTLAEFHGMSVDDLAFDCIADLFRQDDAGIHLEVQSYFSGLPLAEMRDEELLPHLRRLVFSKVNQGIHRLHGESDPGLAKILRNIRLSVSALKNFSDHDRFGDACIAPSLVDTLEHLPPFDRTELELRLCEVATGRELIPQLLAKLALILREQEEYCRLVPVVAVGLLFRSVYERKRAAAAAGDVTETSVGLEDVRIVVGDACREVRERVRRKYVGNGKVSESVLCCYFRAIETELLNRARGRDGDDKTLYATLREFLPDLGKEDYLKTHRSRIEYILKLVGERVSVKLQGGA